MRAVLAISGVAEVWHVYAVTSFVGVSQAIENPARVSLVAQTVSRSHILNAVTLHSGARQITLLIGARHRGVHHQHLGTQALLTR